MYKTLESEGLGLNSASTTYQLFDSGQIYQPLYLNFFLICKVGMIIVPYVVVRIEFMHRKHCNSIEHKLGALDIYITTRKCGMIQSGSTRQLKAFSTKIDRLISETSSEIKLVEQSLALRFMLHRTGRECKLLLYNQIFPIYLTIGFSFFSERYSEIQYYPKHIGVKTERQNWPISCALGNTAIG